MKEFKHRFSVFTATYNRSAYLPLLYQNLLSQTFNDFEWIIINDGSKDNTQEVIESFIKDRLLDIKFINHKTNQGKFQAWRSAMKVMEGEYEIGADDDDIIVPDALETFDAEWKKLEAGSDYDSFWEIRARCKDENGKLVGKPFDAPFDSDYNTFNYAMKNGNVELQGCRKISVLSKEAAVPERFIFEKKASNFPEEIRWSRAARKYKTRFINKVVRIYRKTTDSLIHGPKTLPKIYNDLIDDIYVLNEQSDLILKYRKSDFLRRSLHASYSSIRARESILKYFSNFYLKFLIIVMYPIAFIISTFRK